MLVGSAVAGGTVAGKAAAGNAVAGNAAAGKAATGKAAAGNAAAGNAAAGKAPTFGGFLLACLAICPTKNASRRLSICREIERERERDREGEFCYRALSATTRVHDHPCCLLPICY